MKMCPLKEIENAVIRIGGFPVCTAGNFAYYCEDNVDSAVDDAKGVQLPSVFELPGNNVLQNHNLVSGIFLGIDFGPVIPKVIDMRPVAYPGDENALEDKSKFHKLIQRFFQERTCLDPKDYENEEIEYVHFYLVDFSDLDD